MTSPARFLIDVARDDGADFEEILALQAANRAPTADGFVTVQHSVDILRRMHALGPSVVAREPVWPRGRVIAYALTMMPECRALLPILEPMFASLDALQLGRFYVMGQICVDEVHRGGGIFDALYRKHRALYADRFDLLVTEISTNNPRSMRAHERVGF